MSESWYVSILLSGIAGVIVAAIITLVFSFRIDEIMTTYPHMFPNKIVVYWRVNIRDMDSIEVNIDTWQPIDYAIPLKFKELVYAEYDSRLQEYYDLMERGKEFRKLPKFLRI